MFLAVNIVQLMYFLETPTAANLAEVKAKIDINDFILTELNSLQVLPISLDKQIPILADGYSNYS